MAEQEYKFYMTDDHKGNKALVVVQGHFTKEMEKLGNNGIITDERFFKDYGETINKIKSLLNHATVKADGKSHG